ncbi:MAG TPA: tyrosine-protein phosphatase [Gaiellaceae bacterium]|nr:tyrosine-protein phosphatase [Gaiellaceae bacterium]
MTRALEWEGCLNVRDLGGVALEGGGETRFGSLIRSDNVRRLTDAGWRSLAGHAVTRIVDLRWSEELAEDPPRDLDVEVVHVSLLGELDPDFQDDVFDYMAADDPAGYWATAYGRIVDRHAANFARALGAIADAGEGAVVFHCAGGKDRTGLVAALLLRLAGVSIDEIAHDYSLTAEARARGADAWVQAAPDDRERARRLFMQNTPAEAMRRVLGRLEQEHGSVEGYLRAAGLDDERLERLRGRLRPA